MSGLFLAVHRTAKPGLTYKALERNEGQSEKSVFSSLDLNWELNNSGKECIS